MIHLNQKPYFLPRERLIELAMATARAQLTRRPGAAPREPCPCPGRGISPGTGGSSSQPMSAKPAERLHCEGSAGGIPRPVLTRPTGFWLRLDRVFGISEKIRAPLAWAG
jgi:hypothetical protein